jgi:hypothetical protein
MLQPVVPLIKDFQDFDFCMPYLVTQQGLVYDVGVGTQRTEYRRLQNVIIYLYMLMVIGFNDINRSHGTKRIPCKVNGFVV